MKKVLILCYYFPPTNLTASQKAYAWAKYLNDFGYYPIVVTRNWDIEIRSKHDVVKSSGTDIIHEKKENYEVYYIPYKSSFQNRLFIKNNFFVYSILSKALTFLESLCFNFSNYFSTNKEIYRFADKLLNNNKDIKKMLVTGNPFVFFKMGFLLHKMHNIPWIADYRDMWTTQELHDNDREHFLFSYLKTLEKRSEKKWVGSAEYITSVSEHYVERISYFVGKEGRVVPNGYFHEEFETLVEAKSSYFTLCYSGTLYDAQKVETLIEAYKLLILDHDSPLTKLVFLGAAWKKEQRLRLKKLTDGFQDYIEITDRVNRRDALQVQKSAHILLLFPYEGAHSVIPSKLYEYIGLRTPILMVPGDEDIVDQILVKNNLGYTANTIADTHKLLTQAYHLFLNDKEQMLTIDTRSTEKYTRKSSTQKIALLLNQI